MPGAAVVAHAQSMGSELMAMGSSRYRLISVDLREYSFTADLYGVPTQLHFEACDFRPKSVSYAIIVTHDLR